MKTRGVTPELVALLNGSPQNGFAMADCYTITLNGGTVLQWTSADKAVTIPAYRNDLLWSEAFDNAAWTKTNITVTADAAQGPAGPYTADLLTRTSTAAAFTFQSATKAASALPYVLTVYARLSSGNFVALRLEDGAGNHADACFNLSTGAISAAASVTGTFTSPSAAITSLGSGWYRLTLAATTNTSTTVRGTYSPSTVSQQVDGTGSANGAAAYVVGAQVGPGSTAQTYAPTTSAAVNVAARTFTRGPLLSRDKISHRLGAETSTLSVNINADATDTISGSPLIPFIVGNGLDGAVFRLDRAYMADYSSTPLGYTIEFAGRVTSIRNMNRIEVGLTVSSWMVLFNVQYPPDLYQAPCLNTVFDANCGLTKASFAVNKAISGAGGTTTGFNTTCTNADGYFDQGQIVFTSGANAGVSRAIKSYLNASGAMTLALPLPFAPANGDTFTAYPGCDLTTSTCNTKFANLLKFRGTPYVPPVETAV